MEFFQSIKGCYLKPDFLTKIFLHLGMFLFCERGNLLNILEPSYCINVDGINSMPKCCREIVAWIYFPWWWRVSVFFFLVCFYNSLFQQARKSSVTHRVSFSRRTSQLFYSLIIFYSVKNLLVLNFTLVCFVWYTHIFDWTYYAVYGDDSSNRK